MKPPLTRRRCGLRRACLRRIRFPACPRRLRAGAVTREHGLAIGVLDAVDEDFDFAAHGQAVVVLATRKFLEGDAAFALEADVDHGKAVSIAVTVPLTTRPSKPSSPAPPSCSLSIASKSARVGIWVAIG